MVGKVKYLLMCFGGLFLLLKCAHPQPVVTSDPTVLPQIDAGVGDIPNVDAGPPEEIERPTLESKEEKTEISQQPEESPQEEAPLYRDKDITLAQGIFNLVKKNQHGIWWECGERYQSNEEIHNAALEWAVAINNAHKKTEYKLRSGKYVRVPIREAVGLMISESRFDRCAIGLHPRKFAYKKKILTRPPNHISHSLDEIKKVVEHPAFRGRLADLGVGQIVKRLGKGYTEWNEVASYLTVVPGVQKVFDEMAYRGKIYNTKQPSLYWPGSQKHPNYRLKILRRSIPIFGELKI